MIWVSRALFSLFSKGKEVSMIDHMVWWVYSLLMGVVHIKALAHAFFALWKFFSPVQKFIFRSGDFGTCIFILLLFMCYSYSLDLSRMKGSMIGKQLQKFRGFWPQYKNRKHPTLIVQRSFPWTSICFLSYEAEKSVLTLRLLHLSWWTWNFSNSTTKVIFAL